MLTFGRSRIRYIAMKNKNFVGTKIGEPFENDHGRYVFDLRGDGGEFLNEDGSSDPHNYSLEDINASMRNGTWQFISDAKMKKLFPDVFPKSKIATKPLKIKKGALYFNTSTSQIERAITVVDYSLVWVSHHKGEAKPFPRSAFRMATKQEVELYLKPEKVVQ